LSDLTIAYQALRKPPRLKNDGTGYDWRELDRWFRQLSLLLGAYMDGQKTVNLFTGLQNAKDAEMKIDMFAVNEQEIRENSKKNLDTDTLTNMGE
jgi:hypothetical protein